LTKVPTTNIAFRTGVAQALGGFGVPGALALRLAGFGARPVRFDPEMKVAVTGSSGGWEVVAVAAGLGRVWAAGSARTLELSRLSRLATALLMPVAGVAELAGIVRSAAAEGTADATFWRALPVVATAVATHRLGLVVGWLRPGTYGARVPWTGADLASLVQEPRAVPG
jgi:hypothetical protein